MSGRIVLFEDRARRRGAAAAVTRRGFTAEGDCLRELHATASELLHGAEFHRGRIFDLFGDRFMVDMAAVEPLVRPVVLGIQRHWASKPKWLLSGISA